MPGQHRSSSVRRASVPSVLALSTTVTTEEKLTASSSHRRSRRTWACHLIGLVVHRHHHLDVDGCCQVNHPPRLNRIWNATARAAQELRAAAQTAGAR